MERGQQRSENARAGERAATKVHQPNANAIFAKRTGGWSTKRTRQVARAGGRCRTVFFPQRPPHSGFWLRPFVWGVSIRA